MPNKTQRRGREKGNPRQQKSAGRMGGNPYDPLTTTNSTQESEMANAYSKSRPKKRKLYPEVELTLDNKPDLPQDGQPYMRWMRAIDAHFEMFGFKPGDRVYLEFNFDLRKITITPDHSALNWREQPYGAAAQDDEAK
ncbi:hypothetical protein [Burkholderia diffusa]|uniref:hypothetical protein n=1 Tax=Burkholderia diffusa TaxID=488732 RepID=UPI0020C7387B|nr:hypothetical protein [Burkholderia diffusa]